MKRTDRMVGIEGTAHGRMKSTDSHLIHERSWIKKPDRNSATIIFRLMPTSRKNRVLSAARANTGSLSTVTFSLTTRFIALAQTFSLFRMVNLKFLVKSNGVVPPVNWV